MAKKQRVWTKALLRSIVWTTTLERSRRVELWGFEGYDIPAARKSIMASLDEIVGAPIAEYWADDIRLADAIEAACDAYEDTLKRSEAAA